MTLVSKFLENISNNNLFTKKDKLVLAVSGGVDSVVLCELCHRGGFRFVIAHCNFQLRGEESERDELFVKSLSKKYETEVMVKKFNTKEYAEKNKVSIQVAARELRYTWFAELVGERESSIVSRQAAIENQESGIVSDAAIGPDSHPEQSAKAKFEREPKKNRGTRPKRTGDRELATAEYLVTAHHLDDNIETIMMNFFKGTGISGLRGMLPVTGKVVRPLLFARKEEIMEFAREAQLDYVEDSSNLTEKYSRNYFRLQVLPLIEKIYPGALANIAHNAERFLDIEKLYRQALDMHRKKLIENKGEEIHIPVEKLRLCEPKQTIIYDIIKEYGFTSAQTGEVLVLMDSDTGKYVCSATHRILKNRNWLIISSIDTSDDGIIVIGAADHTVEFSKGQLELIRIQRTAQYQPTTSEAVACLDAAHIQFPILLRKWKKADYFYPLGMQKKKKLARFFIDQKLSLNEKENIWVLEMDKKIIWVIGKRIDHRARIIDQTKEILEIRLKTF